MTISVGDVIWYPGTGQGAKMAKPHMHVLVKVDAVSGDVYCVPISSEASNWDKTCEVDVSDKVPGVTRRSFIAYFHAKKIALTGLVGQLACGTATNNGAMPAKILAKVIQGISISDETEGWFVRDVIPPPAAPTRRVLKSIQSGT
ncbi:hypothetical protein [Methylobacterium indicum]|uniref:hypothetical protein n=1 Tax=Methylobacterium indicum TaxID=1775910 RepID=UPI002435C5A6|nr:hypothetical protein [Methylobacterium indicum]